MNNRAAGKPRAAYGRKERDEDLLLFRDLFVKRENERNLSLLDSVSGEFDSSHGGFQLHKLPSWKKDAGSDILGAGKEKNDYDWLKTPPATPLFPSLEMEANDANLVFQRELPILQPIKPSRFSADKEATAKREESRPPSASSRSTTSSRSNTSRPTSSAGGTPKPRERSKAATTALSSNKPASIRVTTTSSSVAATAKENPRKDISTPKKQNPESRGVSPAMTRPRLSVSMPGFSDEAPLNLITSAEVIQRRATSVTRGRPVGAAPETTDQPKVDTAAKSRRQSCSPSVTRGRKADEHLVSKPRTSSGSSGNGALLLGSKMVERMMNARRSSGEPQTALKKSSPNGTTSHSNKPSSTSQATSARGLRNRGCSGDESKFPARK